MPSRSADPPPPPTKTLRGGKWGGWVAVFAAVACTSSSLPGDFVYDDVPLIVENPRIRSLDQWPAIWLSDWWKHVEGTGAAANAGRDRLYRPLTLQSFALDYAIGGLRPLGYRLVNVLLHGLCCWLVWRFARRLTGDPLVASVAAVLFAVHPVHAEAVAGVVGRAELLTTALLLGGALVLMPRSGEAGLGRLVAAAGLFLAALLAKETAVSFPAVGLLVILATAHGARKSATWWLVRGGILLLPLAVYFPLRYVALEGTLFRSEPADMLMNPIAVGGTAERLVGSSVVLGHYTRLLVVPASLSADYGRAIIDPGRGFDPMAIVGGLAALGLVAGLLALRGRAATARVVGILVALFVASYALISNTALLIGVAVAERLMYWPSVPLLVLAALGIVAFWRRYCVPGAKLAERAALLRVLGVALVAALGIRTAVRCTDWHDNRTLFGRDVQTYPQGAHLNLCYARTLVDDARAQTDPREALRLLEDAEQHTLAALRIHPGYADALSVRGQIRVLLGDLPLARQLLAGALLLRPDLRDARRVLNAISSDVTPGDDPDALREALASQPADVAPRLRLAERLVQTGDPAAARRELAAIVAAKPEHVDALRLAGKTAALTGDTAGAIEYFRQVLVREPDDWESHANLATLLAPSDPNATLAHAERAMLLRPDDVRVQTNYAEALALVGRTRESIAVFRRLLGDLPADDPLRAALAERVARLERGGR